MNINDFLVSVYSSFINIYTRKPVRVKQILIWSNYSTYWQKTSAIKIFGFWMDKLILFLTHKVHACKMEIVNVKSMCVLPNGTLDCVTFSNSKLYMFKWNYFLICYLWAFWLSFWREIKAYINGLLHHCILW